MENVGHNDLNFYHFLKMQRNIPSLGVDEDWDFKVQSRVNQLESEYEAGIYNHSNKKKVRFLTIKNQKICPKGQNKNTEKDQHLNLIDPDLSRLQVRKKI